MALQINLIKDVAARCVERLVEAGYTPTPADDEDSIYTYFSIRHRRVRSQPRAVHKAAYAVPPHLVAGEEQLLATVASGGDLWPHQTRKIGDLSVEDGMLNDWGIQHFHLGTRPDARRPDLIEGTKELLFAIVKDRDFYAIGIYDHMAWTRQALLDVVHATWPGLTKPYTLKGSVGLRHNYSDEEAKKLREAGINVMQQRSDGKVQLGMGGEIASDGSSVAVRRETDALIVYIEELQEVVVATLSREVTAGRLPADAPVSVVWVGDKIYAVPQPTIVKVNITGQLIIPPL